MLVQTLTHDQIADGEKTRVEGMRVDVDHRYLLNELCTRTCRRKLDPRRRRGRYTSPEEKCKKSQVTLREFHCRGEEHRLT
jgi:hypothetical protein